MFLGLRTNPEGNITKQNTKRHIIHFYKYTQTEFYMEMQSLHYIHYQF